MLAAYSSIPCEPDGRKATPSRFVGSRQRRSAEFVYVHSRQSGRVYRRGLSMSLIRSDPSSTHAQLATELGSLARHEYLRGAPSSQIF